jgi:hypothetical protein
MIWTLPGTLVSLSQNLLEDMINVADRKTEELVTALGTLYMTWLVLPSSEQDQIKRRLCWEMATGLRGLTRVIGYSSIRLEGWLYGLSEVLDRKRIELDS